MSAIPATFRAYVAEKVGDAVERGVREFRATDLPDGEVEIRVGWSSVNYKDGLATRADGKVARISPLIPGIDLAGEVVASEDPGIAVGQAVLAHGYELGVSRHGGYAEYERVPAGWVVPLAAGLSPRDAMSIGTAGFTAAMSVVALEERGLTPSDGPVLVTGASGGVGGTVLLRDQALSISGSLGQFTEIDGRRYGHVIDPRSGAPLERERIAAVLASDGARAEAFSKALLILGEREGTALLEASPDAQGILLEADGGSSETRGWRVASRYLPEPPKSAAPSPAQGRLP
jgi:hypothetical protein